MSTRLRISPKRLAGQRQGGGGSPELMLGAPSVQTLVKKLVTQMNALPHDSRAADILGEHVATQCVTEEALEGMRAFLDKRKPKWAA